MAKRYLKTLDGSELPDGFTGTPGQIALYSDLGQTSFSLKPEDVQAGGTCRQEMLGVGHDENGFYIEPATQAEEDALEPILTAP
jgi:hypothetical protein